MNEYEMKKLHESAVERIWLVPGEDVDGGIGYLWCDCPTPSEGMEESEAVEYVRADVAEQLGKATKLEALDELIDSLNEVGGEITINGIQGYRDALARGDA